MLSGSGLLVPLMELLGCTKLYGQRAIGRDDAPSPRYMRERATWSGRVLRSEYLWAWRAGKRLA